MGPDLRPLATGKARSLAFIYGGRLIDAPGHSSSISQMLAAPIVDGLYDAMYRPLDCLHDFGNEVEVGVDEEFLEQQVNELEEWANA